MIWLFLHYLQIIKIPPPYYAKYCQQDAKYYAEKAKKQFHPAIKVPNAYICANSCFMLTPKEEEFLAYWEASRSRQKKFIYQLLVGLPLGLILGILVIANFFSGWYKQADMIANASFNPMVLYVAVAIIAIFFAVFSKRFQWDQQEQRYKELKFKKEKLRKQAEAAELVAEESTKKPEN